MYHNFMPPFPALTHFAVTVSDLDRSIAWYEALFETPRSSWATRPPTASRCWLEPSFALHEHATGSDGSPFDEHRIGLDHVAFGCASPRGARSLAGAADPLGIEHGEIVDAFYGSGLAFRDPDNIQWEFFLPVT